MKILLVTHIFPPAVDGGSQIIAKIGQYFQNNGHQILVLTSDCRSTDDFVNFSSTPVSHHQSHVLALPVYKHLRRPLKFLNLFFHSDQLFIFQKGPIFKLIPYFKSLIAIHRFHPDMIIAGPLPTTIVLYANFIKKITGAKLLIAPCFHPDDPDFSRRPLINVLRQANYIWTQTDFETKYLIKNYDISKSKIFTLGSGIDKTLLAVPLSSKRDVRRTGRFNLLFIGSFASHKGLSTLIDSLNYLPENVTLTLAGQKTLYFPVIEKQLNTRIKIITDFSDAQKIALLDSCTILISPSTQESFGLVILEAWARYKPVIAANIPASTELISKTKGGMTFKVNNSRDLAAKINFLLSNSQLQKDLSKNGHQFVQEHATWDKIGKTLWSKISSS
jgi:glycosyltransferase involved in cell wall biosynthesis